MADNKLQRKAGRLIEEVEVKTTSWAPPPDIIPEDLTPPKKPTDDEILDRRNKVFQLRLRGLTYDAISEILNISVSTVKRDYDDAKKDAKQELTEFDREGFLSDTAKTVDDLIATAWIEYKTTPVGSPQRLKALDLIRTLTNDKFTMWADIGLIQRAAERHENVVTTQVIHGWTPELKEQVAKAYLGVTLTTQLLEPALDTNLDENIIDVTINEDIEKKD